MIGDRLALARSVVGLTFLLLPVLSFAHHSRVDFDTSSVVEVEGELISVVWQNPHPTFTVRSLNPRGEEQLWEIEGSGIYVLTRSGIDAGDGMWVPLLAMVHRYACLYYNIVCPLI